jgi:general secretion pathway protein N
VDSQADRIRLLKEAIQKRRAQQQAATPEGAH